jgi:hypothetical protein
VKAGLAVLKQNSKQLETDKSSKDADIETLRAKKNAEIDALRSAKDAEIAAQDKRITELSRKPYTEELKRITKQVVDSEMTLEGRHVLRHLMINEPVELGRTLLSEIPQDRTYAQLAIAKLPNSGASCNTRKRDAACSVPTG